MKVAIQFVNFPKSGLIRDSVADRINECLNKFSTRATSVKAFFSAVGLEYTVKIALKGAHLSTCIIAYGENAGLSVEKAILKLESFLRRVAAKHKNKKHAELPRGRRAKEKMLNIFDKYEESHSEEYS